MKPQDYAKLESDYSFKRSYLNKTPWWKSLLLVPPVCFLFVGLVGVIYLLKNDMLISLYIIPYLLLFVIGTIWLKAIKRHIHKVKMANAGSFHVCLAKPVWEKENQVFAIFVNDAHRHNKYYIENLVEKISSEKLLEKYNPSFKKEAHLIHDDENDADFYLRVYDMKEINKQNPDWRDKYLFPILYIDDKYTFVIKKKDLVFYTR